MQTATESRLIPFIGGGLNIYTARDNKYTTRAKPATIKRFGPSGSLKNANSALEHMRAVMPKIINEVFFDWKYIFVIIVAGSLGRRWN